MSYPTTPPIRHTPRPWAFPVVQRRVLSWGLTLAAVRLPALPLVQVRWTFRGGRSALPTPATGAARLMANVLRHGTRRRGSAELAEALDHLGARLKAGVSLDQANLTLTGQSAQLAELLDLADELAFEPSFPQAELDRERVSALELHEHERVHAETVAARWLAFLLYEAHPYGWPPTTKAGLTHAAREELEALHGLLFAPERGLLTVVGDVDPERVLEQLAARYATPPMASALLGPVNRAPRSGGRRVVAVDRPGSEQVAVAMGHTVLERTHPDYLALRVANQVFGAGASSRLFMDLRERRSLTYGAFSALDAGALGGDLVASLSTAPAKAAQAVGALRDQWEALVASPLTEDELDPARRFLVGSFPQSASGVAGIGGLVASQWLLGLPDDTWTTYLEALAAIDAGRASDAVARWVRPAEACAVIVGPLELAREAARALGEPEIGEAASPAWEREPA